MILPTGHGVTRPALRIGPGGDTCVKSGRVEEYPFGGRVRAEGLDRPRRLGPSRSDPGTNTNRSRRQKGRPGSVPPKGNDDDGQEVSRDTRR